jgi:hypothetical protein
MQRVIAGPTSGLKARPPEWYPGRQLRKDWCPLGGAGGCVPLSPDLPDPRFSDLPLTKRWASLS